MMNPEDFLLREIKALLKINPELFIKYEFNNNIDVHFILIKSQKDITKTADEIYLKFVDKYPNELVAFLNDKNSYNFNHKVIFDNLITLTDRINDSVERFRTSVKLISSNQAVSTCIENLDVFNTVNDYSKILINDLSLVAGNEEFALAA